MATLIDQLFMPVVEELFACYCTEIALVPEPPARCMIITGTEPEFGVSLIRPGLVALDIEVPLTHADVLAGLLARAEAVRGQAS